MKLNFCASTPILAFGSVYGLVAVLISLDYLNSGRPVAWGIGLLFIAMIIVFVINVVLLIWSLCDPHWADEIPLKRQH